jgi:3-isopropylmalate/(R)-2-methylmalate dehydratase large subunit
MTHTQRPSPAAAAAGGAPARAGAVAGKTIAEKLLSAKSATDARAGDIVLAAVDVAYSHDGNRPLPMDLIADMGATGVWDPARYFLVLDHYPRPNEAVASSHTKLMAFARAQGVRVYAVGDGISHVVLPENGHILPGDLVIGSDSHTCTSGALGAFATGVGSTDMAAVLATGKIWLRVPETILIRCTGEFSPGVRAKDLALEIARVLGADGATYQAIEYAGDTIERMDMDGRLTIANMAIEVGAKAGLMATDGTTAAWLGERTDRAWPGIAADAGARYMRIVDIDVGTLVPKVARPHNVDNVVDAASLRDIPVHQVVIGTCNAARLDDLAEAARILRGKHLAPGVRLYVTPPSRKIMLEAMRRDILGPLVAAGAVIGTPGCSGCVGGCHAAIPDAGENVLTTANRNFKGRLGNPDAFLYLGSAATAAASALTGRITDPRELAEASK